MFTCICVRCSEKDVVILYHVRVVTFKEIAMNVVSYNSLCLLLVLTLDTQMDLQIVGRICVKLTIFCLECKCCLKIISFVHFNIFICYCVSEMFLGAPTFDVCMTRTDIFLQFNRLMISLITITKSCLSKQR